MSGTSDFGPTLSGTYLPRWSLNPNHIVEVLQRPDHVEIVQHDGLQLRIVTKLVERSRNRPVYLLVIEQLAPTQSVPFATKLYPAKADRLEGRSPLELLRWFALKFGGELEIGHSRERFVLSERRRVHGRVGTQLVRVVRGRPGEEYAVHAFVKLTDETPPMLSVAMAFSVNVGAVADHITNPPQYE